MRCSRAGFFLASIICSTVTPGFWFRFSSSGGQLTASFAVIPLADGPPVGFHLAACPGSRPLSGEKAGFLRTGHVLSAGQKAAAELARHHSTTKMFRSAAALVPQVCLTLPEISPPAPGRLPSERAGPCPDSGTSQIPSRRPESKGGIRQEQALLVGVPLPESLHRRQSRGRWQGSHPVDLVGACSPRFR